VDLEESVKLEPDNVAARGMLAMAYLNFGDILRYIKMATELNGLTPFTAEDYLFKGYAQQWAFADAGLQVLNEAVKRSHSPLAHAMRAANRTLEAELRANPEEVERVLADIQVAKESPLADNPFILSVSVSAHMVAANVYLHAGKQEKRQAELKEAERDAQALKRWDTLTFPFHGFRVYFELTGQELALLDLARRAAGNSDAPYFADCYAEALYRRGQTREALEVLDRRKWKTFLGDYYRVCILAELHPQDRRAAYEGMAKRYISENRGFVGYMVTLLCTLGYKDEAVAVLRAHVQLGSAEAWDKDLLDYWTEAISEHEFWKIRSGSMWGRHRGHYEVALVRLTKGDRAGAREHLRQAVQTRVILPYPAYFCTSFLARMEKDPTWPPWIPMKTDEPKP
jgi:hypothetical protein